ncbi:MAG: TraM recognition domain-containing protein [Clostridia bacterium]|nr:TraM recognition domain-containing protein [Clostridia bacterium]
MDGFLTVGGGRKIRFNLFLQSFSQLNSKYDENTAQNILDNCHIWTYLKTSNDTTAEKVSKKLGTYTCSSYSESNSGNIGGSSINKSKSMNLIQRALLTPAEVLRINRPYLLVMYSGQNPAMTQAPDLSKWLFNRLLSLGDEEFCTKVRIIRETAREEQRDSQIQIWDIDKEIQEELRRKKEIKEQARKKARDETKFGYRAPIIESDKDKIYENIEMRTNIDENTD